MALRAAPRMQAIHRLFRARPRPNRRARVQALAVFPRAARGGGARSAQGRAAEVRRMASLISAMERSMASSSRSSTSASAARPGWWRQTRRHHLVSVDTPWVDSNASGVSLPWPPRSRCRCCHRPCAGPAPPVRAPAWDTGVGAQLAEMSSSLKRAPTGRRSTAAGGRPAPGTGPGVVVNGFGGRTQAGEQHVAVDAFQRRRSARCAVPCRTSGRACVSNWPERTMYRRESPSEPSGHCPSCTRAATSVVRGVSIMPLSLA